jgi:hypothetical protein
VSLACRAFFGGLLCGVFVLSSLAARLCVCLYRRGLLSPWRGACVAAWRGVCRRLPFEQVFDQGPSNRCSKQMFDRVAAWIFLCV